MSRGQHTAERDTTHQNRRGAEFDERGGKDQRIRGKNGRSGGLGLPSIGVRWRGVPPDRVLGLQASWSGTRDCLWLQVPAFQRIRGYLEVLGALTVRGSDSGVVRAIGVSGNHQLTGVPDAGLRPARQESGQQPDALIQINNGQGGGA